MVCETFAHGSSPVHKLDPRSRIVAGLAFAVMIALSRVFVVLGGALAISAVLAITARLPLKTTLKRLMGVNVFMLALLLFLPLSVPGETALSLGPLAYSGRGLIRVLRIALKCNAIVLMLTVLLGTMELVELGHALHHLKVPRKLVHILLFTIRYVDLVHHEYRRLRKAMKVRGFRADMSAHTYRSIGHLVGMLLVRSFDRAERVLAAMKCRGFRGDFHVLTRFAFTRRDIVFSCAFALTLCLLGGAEWALVR
ncbi:MAG: cobalt ECF transporter T component CbiQ [Planctomycetota bacterium]